MNFRKKIKAYTNTPISHQVVMDVLANYNRPNDKISELLKSGELQALRRGLYVPGPEIDLPVPELFLLANHLRGPSYVSLESALAHHGFIPERVYEISSATLKTSKTYTTPVGRFSYQYLPAPYYSFGLQRTTLAPQQVALIASPEKAICDKIVLTNGLILRSVRQASAFLREDLRIEATDLRNLDIHVIQSWITDAPKKSSLAMLVKTLEQL